MPYVENLPPYTLSLDDSTTIWRYLSLPAFVSLLQRKGLYFSKLATLARQDPYEGKLPEGIKSDLAGRYRPEPGGKFRDGNAYVQDMQKRSRERRAVNCWHMSDVESAAMWKLYSGDHGIAIRTTLGALKKSFTEAEAPVYAYEVEYLDFADSNSPPLAFHSGYAKRKNFAHERELRACTFVFDGDASPGASVAVNLDVLIGTVFIAPEAEEWLKEVVEGLLEVYGVYKPVFQSRLYDEAVR